MWPGVCPACPHSHREVSEMPTLFRLGGNLSAIRARVRFLSSPGSCSFEVMPGALRNICMSASLSDLQSGSVSSSIGASTMFWCFLYSSLYWWFRLWCSRRLLVGCARLVCRGWEGSLLSFSPWMRILRLLLLLSGSTFLHHALGWFLWLQV